MIRLNIRKATEEQLREEYERLSTKRVKKKKVHRIKGEGRVKKEKVPEKEVIQI